MSLYPDRPHTTGAPHVTLAPTSALSALAVDAPSGSRRRLVMVMALATTLAEIGSIAGWLPLIPVGVLRIPLSFLPALGLAAEESIRTALEHKPHLRLLKRMTNAVLNLFRLGDSMKAYYVKPGIGGN